MPSVMTRRASRRYGQRESSKRYWSNGVLEYRFAFFNVLSKYAQLS